MFWIELCCKAILLLIALFITIFMTWPIFLYMVIDIGNIGTNLGKRYNEIYNESEMND
jgi:hypothetical protein